MWNKTEYKTGNRSYKMTNSTLNFKALLKMIDDNKEN